MDKNFRNYENELVNNTYKRMYREQTLEKKLNYKIYPISNKSYNIEQILPLFDTIIDESDPDTDLPQSIHLLQTYILHLLHMVHINITKPISTYYTCSSIFFFFN